MGALSWLTLLLTHPFEFRTLIQYAIYHEQKRDITAQEEFNTSGWDRASMRRCWEFLDLTSRSFSAVIKELDGDLARVVCLFYLVLRGLDTVEDDMTIPDGVKQPILRNFHVHTVTPGWNFDGNGPNEKDRQLLVEYHVVVEELNRLPQEYKSVIVDICEKMQTGMADYAHKAATTGAIYIPTIEEHELYCHYVAGLVGEGLSGLFSSSGKEAPWLRDQLKLSNSMGLFLQKTNIIRDYREDLEDKRHFWPKEIWGRFGFEELGELHLPENAERASHAQSAMILDCLRHATDSLDYLKTLKNQSVFNFCAIPQTMAIATLELCFMNPAMLQRNVKIRKAVAASLIMRSTNPREVAGIFVEYARKIHAKIKPTDPSFMKISVACGQIEQWREHNYPTFIEFGDSGKMAFNPSDARTRLQTALKEKESALVRRRVVEKARVAVATGQQPTFVPEQTSEKEMILYVAGALILVVLLCMCIVFVILHFTGDLPKLLPPAWRGQLEGDL